MPRIAKHLEKCVFFLFGHHPRTGELTGPGATGFFVGRQSETLHQVYHVYAISNRHAVSDFSCIRINKDEDKTRIIELDPVDWQWSDTDDLAAVDVTDHLSFNAETNSWLDRISWVNEFDFVSKEIAWFSDIGIGDQTVMLGLFADHAGGLKNLPVGRFGYLAATPDDSNPVKLELSDRLSRPSYLNGMRSRSGFSGSPVWVWRTPHDDMNRVGFNGRDQLFHPRNAFLYLVGVHRGQFREQTIIRSTEAERALHSGDRIEIASSMTVLVPAWEITTLLDKATFRQKRVERDSRNDRVTLANEIEALKRL